MSRRSFAAFVLLFAVVCRPGAAAGDAIDAYLETEMQKRRIPGLALAVVRNGEVIRMQGYGLANVELDVAVTPDTVFELASVTKQFTATAIMLLAEEGKLRIDDPISRHLANTPEAWKDITVRHLLTHTAGLASMETGFAALYAEGLKSADVTTAQMFDAATKDPMSSRPGERWQYSDVGYFLLGMIVEKASGQRYRAFVTQRFFKPLGMSASSVLDQYAIVRNLAAGYTLRNGRLAHIRRFLQVELPSHYGIFSTVRDLVRWDAALAAGKVVKRESLAQMWTPVKLNDGTERGYGFGWGVDERRGHAIISHTGITGTEYARFPDDGLTVIVLTNLGRNLDTTGVNSWGLAIGVAGRYIPGMLASLQPEQTDTAPERSAKLRDFLGEVAAGREAPLMTPGLRKALNPAASATLAGRLKTLQEFAFITCDSMTGRSLVRIGASVSEACHYRMRTASETRYYTFWLTAAGGLVADFNSYLE